MTLKQTFLVAGLVAAALPAQIPFDHLIVSTRDTTFGGTGDGGIHIINPANGVVTGFQSVDQFSDAQSVSQHPTDPTQLFVQGNLAGGFPGFSLTIRNITGMEGNRHPATTTLNMTGGEGFGTVHIRVFDSTTLLWTVSGGSQNDL